MFSADHFIDASRATTPHRMVVERMVEILLAEQSLPSARTVVDALRHCVTAHRLTVTLGGEETLEFLGRRGRFARAPRIDLILLGLPPERGAGLNVLESAAKTNSSSRPMVAAILSDAAPPEMQAAANRADVQLGRPVDVDALATLVEQTHRRVMLINQ